MRCFLPLHVQKEQLQLVITQFVQKSEQSAAEFLVWITYYVLCIGPHYEGVDKTTYGQVQKVRLSHSLKHRLGLVPRICNAPEVIVLADSLMFFAVVDPLSIEGDREHPLQIGEVVLVVSGPRQLGVHLGPKTSNIIKQIQGQVEYISLLIIFSLMSGKLNKEEQVQVVIRLKPVPKELISTRSVYVSDEQQKTLVVETPNKKEYFVFDNIADDACSQQEIYQYIGQDAVKSSTDGYNCCIFAYGQTGAGKTYSILGNSQDILNDLYADSRGILPRLLSDLFSWCENATDRFWIKCSYLQIYNQQIIDLLNPDLKLRQIREDFKKGVYVQGLSEQNATNYQDAMAILMKGVKNRKTSATSMNDESSRSHSIFTLSIESEIKKDDITKTRRSKINIVDLAGSERAKQTKVEGDRLKQGCNINKSLHVLGNVINALVESTKKKKHIPFRDSKLTYFLKDSLSGNSITKLLANIHPSKAYLGDTLSTLMFAKRAKILKMKVEVNENMTENFQQLRKQIRKLREELAQARYIKNESKIEKNMNESQQEIPNLQKMIDMSNFDNSKHEQLLQVFEQNESNYKALIDVYEQHIKNCAFSMKIRKSVNMHQQWKNIEKKNQSLTALVKNVPAFTKIFKQNLRLKNQIRNFDKQAGQNVTVTSRICKQSQNSGNNQIREIRRQYEELLKQVETRFSNYICELESAYEQLQADNRAKEDRIRELRKRKQMPPDMEELANENEYLKLNILELEDEINNYEQKERKLLIQIKELKKQSKEAIHTYQQGEDTFGETVNFKLAQLKVVFQKESKQYQEQKAAMLLYIDKLKEKLIQSVEQNKNLLENLQATKQQSKGLKRKLNSLLKINNEVQIKKEQNTYTNTFWTNEESNISQELQIFNNRTQGTSEKQEYSKSKIQSLMDDEKMKGIDLSSQILKLHKSYNEEILKLREEIKNLERARRQLSEQNYIMVNKLRNMQSFDEIEEGQLKVPKHAKTQHSVEVTVSHARSTRELLKLNEPDVLKHLSKSRHAKDKLEGSPQPGFRNTYRNQK